jgi:hypothetical protein
VSDRLFTARADLLPLDVVQWRRPGNRRFQVATEPASERDVRTRLVACDCQFKLAIRTFRRSCPRVKRDARVAHEEESFSVLLCQRPSLRKRRLRVRSGRDEVRIILLAIEQTHEPGACHMSGER